MLGQVFVIQRGVDVIFRRLPNDESPVQAVTDLDAGVGVVEVGASRVGCELIPVNTGGSGRRWGRGGS